MRSVEITQFGLDNLVVREKDPPEPGPGQVVVRVRSASVNYRDFLIAQGLYNPPDLALPQIPLSDGAGDVAAVGDGVSRASVGDRVSSVFWQNWPDGPAAPEKIGASTGCEAPGMATDFAVLPETAVVKIPDGMSYEAAATLPCAALTAWTALTTVGGTKPGDAVLVLGTGGVSIFALQIAKALGATVIITSCSDAKLERARELGADYGINYDTHPDWGKEAFGRAGLGVNTVVECGGVGTLSQSIEALAWDGHIAFLGSLTGLSAELNLFGLVLKGAHLHGLMVGSRVEHENLLEFVTEHKIEPVVDSRYDLDQTGQALSAIPTGQHFGKIVINVG